MREWLVIESTRGRSVFASDEDRDRKSYIPRDVAEELLGRDLGGDRCQWFTDKESQLMREHPEWRDSLPPGSDPHISRSLHDTATGGFLEGEPPRADGWRSVRRSKPANGAIVDVWLRWGASARTMGWSDSFGVPDAWREGDRWLHTYRGKPTELNREFVSPWRPTPPPPDEGRG